jgi:hypothetical protein
MTKVRQPADPFAKRELEGWNRSQLAPKAQHFQRFICGLIENVAPDTQPVLKEDSCRG